MAKKKAANVNINKSQEIRDYKRANPTHQPKQIAAELAKRDIEVSAQFVSTILSTSKKKKIIRKPGRPKGSTSAKRGRPALPLSRSRTTAGSHDVSLDSIIRVKEIVREMGSIDDARAALTALEQLMD